MSSPKHNATVLSGDSDILEAISAFEKILEVMPNDLGALMVLAHGYHQIGDHVKAADYLVRLGHEVLRNGEMDAVADLLDRLSAYREDERVADLTNRLTERLNGAAGAGGPAMPAEAALAVEDVSRKADVDVRSLSTFRISEELSLAWNLMEADELTQDEYASVVQDLSEMSSTGGALSVSVLHVLESRGFKQFDRILSSLSRDCGTPIVALSNYEYQYNVTSLLSLDFCVKRGALVFERIGEELLVIVLNPQDQTVRRDVKTITGAPCHFFLALPSEFDQLIARYRETVEHGEASES